MGLHLWLNAIDEFSWFNGAKDMNGEQKLINECRGSERLYSQRPESTEVTQDQTNVI